MPISLLRDVAMGIFGVVAQQAKANIPATNKLVLLIEDRLLCCVRHDLVDHAAASAAGDAIGVKVLFCMSKAGIQVSTIASVAVIRAM